MPKAFTPEWGLDIQNQVPVTARPDFLLSKRDRLAELNSFTGRSKHPGSKPRFAHRHQSWQMEPRRLVAEQAVILPETQVPPIIEGVEAIDSPLMAAAFFAVIGSGEWGRKNVPRLLVTALVLAGCLGVVRQESTSTPENPPAVVVVTNTPLPDLGLTQPTATLTATPTETPISGAGGPELPGGAPDQIRSLLETGMNLPITDCVTTPETGGNKEVWDNWIKTLVENGANQTAIDELKATISAKLGSQGISYSTRTLELCGGGDGGWSLVIRDKSSGLFWWSFDLGENRFADRPDRVFNDRDWQFRPMPREGLKSGLEVEILMVNGWPLAIAVNPEGRPIQHFDPVLREFINFYPDTPTPTRTASAIPTITNTPRPTAIPATAIPKPSPTFTLEPSPTATPASSELWSSTYKVQPTLDELKLCTTGIIEQPIDGSNEYYSRFKNDYITAIDGNVITYNGGERVDLTQFRTAYVYQFTSDKATRFEYKVQDLVNIIKPGDFVDVYWDLTGVPTHFYLECRAK